MRWLGPTWPLCPFTIWVPLSRVPLQPSRTMSRTMYFTRAVSVMYTQVSKTGHWVILRRQVFLYNHHNRNLETELCSRLIYLHLCICMCSMCPNSHYSQQKFYKNGQQWVISLTIPRLARWNDYSLIMFIRPPLGWLDICWLRKNLYTHSTGRQLPVNSQMKIVMIVTLSDCLQCRCLHWRYWRFKSVFQKESSSLYQTPETSGYP